MVRQMKDYRARAAQGVQQRMKVDASLEKVVATFEHRKVKGPEHPVTLQTSVTQYGSHELRFGVNGNRIIFELKKEEDRKALATVDPRTVNLVRSVSNKLDRSKAFYRKLLLDAGFDQKTVDGKLPGVVSFDLYSGTALWGGSSDRGKVNLGYKSLLDDYGVMMGHEAYHVVAQRILGKDEGMSRSSPLVEALADYYTAVINNQPNLAKPTLRSVKNSYNERDLKKRYSRPEQYHEMGQLFSGCLWKLRKTINRKDGRAWADISYVDKLALVAHSEFTQERLGGAEVNLSGWVKAMVQADRKLSKGKHKAEIERIGNEYLRGH